MTRLHFLAALLGVTAGARGQDQGDVVFLGYPVQRSTNKLGENETITLGKEEGERAACKIVRRGHKFFWASRSDNEMMKNINGDFIVYTALNGGGYVKVVNPASTQGNLPIDYLEHVHVKLNTITYWGKSSTVRQ